MRTVRAREMWGYSALGRVSGCWRRGLGVSAAPKDSRFGTEARHQLQPRSSSKRLVPLGDQPFPGLLRPKNLSREELVDVLRAAVVDEKGPLVTLNKPQGLPVTGKPGELTLLSVLPELSQSLGVGERELQVVQAPGKETSGLVLLCSCPQTASHLQKFYIHSRRAQRPTATYCAVTDGIPATSEGKIQAPLKLEHIDGVNLVVPVKSPSRKDILEGVKRTSSHFRVVATGSGCALVQLQPLTVFPSQLQVHMVLQLCPVLGDHTYSARVGTVLGQRFLLPAESTKPSKQVLEEALLRRLRVSPSQAAQLPLHLHLHCLLLPGTRSRDTPMKLLAPLPPYFSRTLQCLGLLQQQSSLCS
ncbi:PREDICTED: RNA pseudouridylate synthase domain-containing protein 3 isoform X1 [Galeopterus variegatus]|uniref:RNA pseudouridylate synthase domain-containing protein 3 isoform X1 n=1 Tax=Galeopterus variegatus TaxID=482537 RepID=A0ABM0R513_GALVR|nr:PREDICTED: RNA pseudouridylate synthase domain-containing protein 3 isoform X1 [Galeopterus variegatus]